MTDTQSKSRAPVEDYYPNYVNPEEVEFDYCFGRCACGWETEAMDHPRTLDDKLDMHREYGRTPDCGINTNGSFIFVFEDGSTASV